MNIAISDYAGQLTLVAGWGRTGEKEQTSRTLRSVVIPVWSKEQCDDAGYGKHRLTENMMCGGYHDGGKDACQVSFQIFTSNYTCRLIKKTICLFSIIITF